MRILATFVCIYIGPGIYFKGLWSLTTTAWVENISVLIAILQRQHKDSVDQLEFDKQERKEKQNIYVNYICDDNYDERYIECSLFNLGMKQERIDL